MQGLRQLSTFIGQTFALWAIVFAIAGFTAPQVFTPFRPAIPYALGMIIFGVVILHNLLGYLLGLLAARAAGLNSAQRRAIMIEVGMQNSALGATLGTKYFSPEAALPSAIFSVWHNISGALVANICTWWDKRHGK